MTQSVVGQLVDVSKVFVLRLQKRNKIVKHGYNTGIIRASG